MHLTKIRAVGVLRQTAPVLHRRAAVRVPPDADTSDERRTFHSMLREAVVVIDGKGFHDAVGRQEALRSDGPRVTVGDTHSRERYVWPEQAP